MPDADQIASLRTWLTGAAEFYTESPNGDLLEGWEFFLHWPAALGDEPDGGSCLGGIQLYAIDPEAECSGSQSLTPGEWTRFRNALGWMPGCELFVSIFCNRRRDQKLLAWLCAELAERFDGMVDLGGPLSLPDRSEWARTGLAGAVVDVPPEVDTGSMES